VASKLKYEIKIPKPCNESWSEMTPTEKGAFCSNCKREVFDFTKMSNYQLAKLLDDNQNMCGKFKREQLDIDIQSLKNKKPSNVGILLGISAFLSVSYPAFSQSKKTEEIRKIEQSNKINERTNNKKINDSILIRGHIFDKIGSLPGTNVVLKGHSNVTQTDFDGNFSINIKKEELEKNPILVFSFIGYKTQEKRITKDTEFLKVKMLEENVIMGEVIIIKKQNIFRRIGNLFRKKDKKTCH
jgi:hypothetical protein